MKKIICVNTKGYALTEGNGYDVIKESNGYVFIINDNGKTVRYVSDLFEDDDEQPNIPQAPPAPIVITLTEAECIASVADNGSSFRNTNNEIVHLDLGTLNNSESHISCGISEFSGINSIMNHIQDQVPGEDDRLELKKAILKKRILYSLEQGRAYAIGLMSTNLNEDEDLVEALDEIAHFTSNTVNNPNSDNEIKMWGFYKNQL